MATESGYSGPQRSFLDRVKAAAKLDVSLYEEVEADKTATRQAALVVAASAVAHAIGSSDEGAAGVFVVLGLSLAGWAAWAAITYFVGAKVFHGTANWGELARTLGFAQAPGLLYLLVLIPILGGLIEFIVGIWILIAGFIAIRQALDITTGQAVVVAFMGLLVLVIPPIVLGAAAWLTFR
ncbi:MAG: YIP1 family protein [Longimicrobiales bacterium]